MVSWGPLRWGKPLKFAAVSIIVFWIVEPIPPNMVVGKPSLMPGRRWATWTKISWCISWPATWRWRAVATVHEPARGSIHWRTWETPWGSHRRRWTAISPSRTSNS
uniref:Uncharacterized protein n=1 Tax=Opuntia streptacantha TaxID=393608 RepID=A0A7C9AXG7_OPUST